MTPNTSYNQLMTLTAQQGYLISRELGDKVAEEYWLTKLENLKSPDHA